MNKRYYIGPIITVVLLIIHQQLIEAGIIEERNAAGLYLIFLFVGFTSGLRAGVASALILTFYSLAYFGPITQQRLIVSASYLIAAGLMGWQTRRRQFQHDRANVNQEKADIVDNVNGNLRLALGAIDILDSLRFGWGLIEERNRLTMIEQARGKLADQVTLHRSFRQMAAERGFVLAEDKDATNSDSTLN